MCAEGKTVMGSQQLLTANRPDAGNCCQYKRQKKREKRTDLAQTRSECCRPNGNAKQKC